MGSDLIWELGLHLEGPNVEVDPNSQINERKVEHHQVPVEHIFPPELDKLYKEIYQIEKEANHSEHGVGEEDVLAALHVFLEASCNLFLQDLLQVVEA